MNIYFISGLGIDSRVFKKLQLPADYNIHYLEWIQPLPKENITHYAKRLAVSIDQSKPFILIGLSFGGMIASEMNTFLKPVKTILISSAASSNELPPYFKWIGFSKIHKLVPAGLLKKPNPLFYWIFGIRTKEEKIFFRDLLKDTDSKIVKWSVNAIVNWKKKTIPLNLMHIHGTADYALPIQFVKPTIVVKKGGHLMVYIRAAELSSILTKALEE